MDYSHLHTYAPPQCVPENTGYTYALSSSYSSAALDFENLHKLDPVFDSPRMSRRSLRLTTTVTSFSDSLHNDSIASNASNASFSGSERSHRSLRQQHNTSRQSSSSRRSATLKAASNTSLHSSFSTNVGDTSTLSTVLDESSIREQTELDHLWGLDDDDLKAGDTTVIRANGDVLSTETQTTLNNGYTCNDCSMLSERSNALTAFSASCTPALSTYTTSTKVYSRSQKHKSRKAASGMFWWLGTGWYQLTTLVSLLNVFLLTRCLPKASRWLLLLIPLLLLLGLWWWGFDPLLALLPSFSGFTSTRPTTEDPIPSLKPMPDIDLSKRDTKELGLQFDSRMKELEQRLGLITAHHNHHLEDYNQLRVLVVNIQEQMGQLNDQGDVSSMIANLLDERFAKIKVDMPEKSTDGDSVSKNHEARILHLEALLTKLSEAVEEDRKRPQTNASESNIQDQSFLRKRIESLEEEFALYKAEFLKEQTAKSSCDLSDCVLQKVDARVREAIQMMFGSQANLPESIVQWISANYVSNEDLGARLQELELRILRNITYQISVTKKMPSPKVVEGAVTAGVSGITEEEALVLVNNALKLYTQDRTGMVDFALESGGGSVLGTRCSETYGTKTALLSLFGIPLWYLSQSPRVVIQPDMYPGNCWAFKGAQGYLVVRLSMAIYPTAFSLEHISKSLSPTGNITSAPKDFAVFGLDDEYQEDGTLLVQSTYDQDGEQLQTFQVMGENQKPFQIVELRILSNWGHADYTCLYRFRAHGTPVK